MLKILFVLLSIAVHPAHAEIYKWVDEDGKVHFSDVKPVGKKTQELKLKLARPAAPGPGGSVGAGSGSNRVTMYGTSWCGYCAQARQHFHANGIPYTEYDIERSETAKRKYDQLGGKGVPVILVGNKRMNGFSVSGFNGIYSSDR